MPAAHPEPVGALSCPAPLPAAITSGALLPAEPARAQIGATLIAIFGFNGFDNPRAFVKPCIFCRLSSGGRSPFFSAKKAPQGRHVEGGPALYDPTRVSSEDNRPYTESVYTDSIVGCECAPCREGF